MSVLPSPLSCLREERKAMQLLLDVIQQEQAQLVAMDVDMLDQLTLRKNSLVSQMATLSGQRLAALAAAGFAAREDAMAGWLAQSGEVEAGPLWQELLSLTREAKESNRLNGMLINKHLVHTQGALQALRPAASGATTYGPSGQTMRGPSSGRFVVG